MSGPSRHLSWNELACWNRLSRPFNRFQPGELVAAYPAEWREGRAVHLADTFEDIRRYLGGSPITVTSGFRTPAYNAVVDGTSGSQHVQGRALDIQHSTLSASAVFFALQELQRAGKLPHLGGLGRYRTFVHVDVRPKLGNRLAVWSGSGVG